MLDVLLEATQDVLEDAQKPVGAGGRMPVDTGFLRASLRVMVGPQKPALQPSTAGLGLNKGQRQAAATGGAPDYALQLTQLDLGDFIAAQWTAHYAHQVEFGSAHYPGRLFVTHAAMKWKQFVEAAAKRVASGNF